jgi:hypothetical protein
MSVCECCRQMDYGECNHVREGKTKKDHASGAWSNRFSNIAARAAWGKTGGAFPRSTCNGKRNRFFK